MENSENSHEEEITHPQPNIAFVGKNHPPIEFVTDGENLIQLPAGQSAPFYHPDAARIIRLLPELYKPVVKK